MGEERCETCRYFDPCDGPSEVTHGDEGEGSGYCRRNPKQWTGAVDTLRQPTDRMNLFRWSFPPTEGGDWCGEFQPRKPLPVVGPQPATGGEVPPFLRSWDSAWRARFAEMIWPGGASLKYAVIARSNIKANCVWPARDKDVMAYVRSVDVPAIICKLIARGRPGSGIAAYLRSVLAANGHPLT